MKKVKRILPLLLLPSLFVVSCTDDDNFDARKGNGTLQLTVDIKPSLEERMSRSIPASERDSLLKKLTVVVSTTADGTPVKYWNGGEDIPWGEDSADKPVIEFKLGADDYIVEAWSGDSVPASFTKRFYKATSKVTVAPDVTNTFALDCKIANVGVRVSYEDEIDDVLDSYSLTIGHIADSLKFEGRTDLTGYFMMPKADKNLVWKFRGKAKDGKNFEKCDTIENAQPGTLYALNFSYTSADSEMGGAFFDVKLVEEDNTKWDAEWTYAIRTAPVVKGFSGWIDSNTPDYWPSLQKIGPRENFGEVNLVVLSSGKLKSVKLRCDEFRNFLNATQIEVLHIEEDDYYFSKFKNRYNMSRDSILDDDTQTSYLRLRFCDGTIAEEFADGTHEITVTVTDIDRRHCFWPNDYPKDDRTVEAVFTLTIGDDKTSVIAVPQSQKLMLWDTEILLKGQVNGDDAIVYGFKWWKKSDANKTELGRVTGTSSVQSTVSPSETIGGDNSKFFYAVVNKTNFPAMEEGVEYEYCTYYDGMDAEMTTGTFVLENPQLPNANFEAWISGRTVGTKDYVIPAKSTNTNDLFWGSGNPGSITMDVNVTDKSTDYKNSGDYSALLASQKVGIKLAGQTVGKFAAGNIFIGEYLKTDGTDGVLGWGKPWTSRPRQLKGWVRYEGVDITESSGNGYTKGDPDVGIIYIALLDNDMTTQGDSNYPGYPVVVRTKDSHLFQKDAKNVIAYGEITFTGTIPETGMQQFTVDLEYNRKDVVPSYIMLTASASKGGDYFKGGDGSKMWIDDLELVY